jgi:hypothetical protein
MQSKISYVRRLIPQTLFCRFSLISLCRFSSPSITTSIVIRGYKSSVPCLAKASKGKKKNDDDDVEIDLPKTDEIKSNMEKRITRLTEELSKIRAGMLLISCLNA